MTCAKFSKTNIIKSGVIFNNSDYFNVNLGVFPKIIISEGSVRRAFS